MPVLRTRKPKAQPTWSDVKAKLIDFDRVQLLSLLADLYSASHDNQTFLHTRFALGEDPLKVHKQTISRWLYPDVQTREVVSLAKARKAITDYRRAVGKPEGLAELMTHYCEEASAFATDLGLDDGDFYNALVSMFENALTMVAKLEAGSQAPFRERLEVVRARSNSYGYCAGDSINDLWERLAT